MAIRQILLATTTRYHKMVGAYPLQIHERRWQVQYWQIDYPEDLPAGTGCGTSGQQLAAASLARLLPAEDSLHSITPI